MDTLNANAVAWCFTPGLSVEEKRQRQAILNGCIESAKRSTKRKQEEGNTWEGARSEVEVSVAELCLFFFVLEKLIHGGGISRNVSSLF